MMLHIQDIQQTWWTGCRVMKGFVSAADENSFSLDSLSLSVVGCCCSPSCCSLGDKNPLWLFGEACEVDQASDRIDVVWVIWMSLYMSPVIWLWCLANPITHRWEDFPCRICLYSQTLMLLHGSPECVFVCVDYAWYAQPVRVKESSLTVWHCIPLPFVWWKR